MQGEVEVDGACDGQPAGQPSLEHMQRQFERSQMPHSTKNPTNLPLHRIFVFLDLLASRLLRIVSRRRAAFEPRCYISTMT